LCVRACVMGRGCLQPLVCGGWPVPSVVCHARRSGAAHTHELQRCGRLSTELMACTDGSALALKDTLCQRAHSTHHRCGAQPIGLSRCFTSCLSIETERASHPHRRRPRASRPARACRSKTSFWRTAARACAPCAPPCGCVQAALEVDSRCANSDAKQGFFTDATSWHRGGDALPLI
jgi:hypothetical protein